MSLGIFSQRIAVSVSPSSAEYALRSPKCVSQMREVMQYEAVGQKPVSPIKAFTMVLLPTLPLPATTTLSVRPLSVTMLSNLEHNWSLSDASHFVYQDVQTSESLLANVCTRFNRTAKSATHGGSSALAAVDCREPSLDAVVITRMASAFKPDIVKLLFRGCNSYLITECEKMALATARPR